MTEASAFTDPAINDVRPQAANNYTYYDNGALKTDLANDLSLEYNAAGLTTAVRNATGTQLKLSFVYDEQGQRIRKLEYTAGTLSKTTLYLRGAEGGLRAVYEAPAAGAYVQKELLLDGGVLGTYFGDQVNRYVYALTDHLGNVRATVDRDLSGGAVQQLSYADYYAWGMPLPGREAASSPRYRLGYQGQEYESKVGLYGFGLRLYDQRLGRWLSADPYGQHWSPYLAMSNNPVSFVDADGGWSRSVVKVEWGQLFDNAEYDWYSYNNRWGSFNEWSGSRFNNVLNPVQGHDYSQMSKEVLRVSEQVAPDDWFFNVQTGEIKWFTGGFSAKPGSDWHYAGKDLDAAELWRDLYFSYGRPKFDFTTFLSGRRNPGN